MIFEDFCVFYVYVDFLIGKFFFFIFNMFCVGKFDDLMQVLMYFFGMFWYFFSVEGGYILGFVIEEEDFFYL